MIADQRARRHQPLLQFIGHAGFVLRYGNVSLLCDPWVSKTGAYLQSWHQFPPNDFLDWNELYAADYLYISHEHQDHFDEEFLRGFPKDKVTVLIADFISTTMAAKLAALGFPRIVKLADWMEFPLADGFSIQVVKDHSLYQTDSFLIAQCGSWTILNKNDCHIPIELATRLTPLGIDLLLAQFSGETWHPFVYGYEANREYEMAAQIKGDALDALVTLASEIGVRHVIPCAGPPCFLEDATFHLNFEETGIFPDQHDVSAAIDHWLDGDVHLALPGDLFLLADSGDLELDRTRPFDFERKAEELEAYRDRRAAGIARYLEGLRAPGADFLADFENHLRALFSSSTFIRARINALLHFDLTGEGGGSIFVDTREGDLVIARSATDTPSYSFTLSAAVAQLLVEGEETWEGVLLSMRFRVQCQPNDDHWPLFALLRFGNEVRLIAEVERAIRKREEKLYSGTYLRLIGTSRNRSTLYFSETLA
jgi:UDP-MurNAc hydroxylase